MPNKIRKNESQRPLKSKKDRGSVFNKVAIIKTWKKEIPNFAMTTEQNALLDLFLQWQKYGVAYNAMAEIQDAKVCYLYMGRRAGNSTLWQIIKKAYPNKITLVSIDKDHGQWLGADCTYYNLEKYARGRNLGIVVFDYGNRAYTREIQSKFEDMIGKSIEGIVYA
jgi:hypothetical protein